MEEVTTILSTTLDFWYITLPASVFLMFGARYAVRIIFMVIGFLIGLNVVFPWISSFDIFQPILTVETNRYFALILISLLTAVLVYVLYKYLIFIGAFLVTFVLFLLFERTIVQRFDLEFPHWEWLQYLPPALVGGLAGCTAYRREEEFSRILSVTIGSLVFSLLSLYGIMKLFGIDLTIEEFLKSKSLLSIYFLVVLSLELITLRIVLGAKGRHGSRDDGTKAVH